MKKSFLGLVLAFLLIGCESNDSEIPRNTSLDTLSDVVEQTGYKYSSDMSCQVLTATNESDNETQFHVRGLETPTPVIGFDSENFNPIAMDIVNGVRGFSAFVIFSNKYQQSYFLLDKESGVFSFSNLQFLDTLEKSTFKGNCTAL